MSGGRYSIRQEAIDHLMALQEHFKTTDISLLIMGVCIERNLLTQRLGTTPGLAAVAPKTTVNPTLDEYSALLD